MLAVLGVIDAPLPGWAFQADSAVAAQSPSRGGGSPQGRSGQLMAPWDWWNDADVQRELGLAADKVQRINDIYTRRSEDLKPIVEEFVKQSAELEKMTRARLVDERTYSVQVMHVESARSELNKSRTVMLYRLTRELTPEQYKKLQDIRDRRFGSRGRGPDPK